MTMPASAELTSVIPATASLNCHPRRGGGEVSFLISRLLLAIIQVEPSTEWDGCKALSAHELRRGNAMTSGVAPRVSIVIPVLDEEAWIGASLAALTAVEGGLEVLVVDGGSRDRTRSRAFACSSEAARRGIRLEVLAAERGRASQMNAGAARARGEVLLFLHADTLLPAGALPAVLDALSCSDVVGGGFRHSFQEDGLGLRLISAASNLRARLWRTLYGDQAIFLRRSAFESLGGFRSIPIFEDADLSARMRRLGSIVLLPLAVRTSGRRYLRGGVARTALRMARMKLAYLGGRDPGRLAGEYRDAVRRGGASGGPR